MASKAPDQLTSELAFVDGVMIGREAYQNPYALAWMQQAVFDDPSPIPSRHDIVRQFLDYIDGQLSQGVPLHAMTRHILGLFNGQRGARSWRRHLSTAVHDDQAGVHTIEQALSFVLEPTDKLAAA